MAFSQTFQNHVFAVPSRQFYENRFLEIPQDLIKTDIVEEQIEIRQFRNLVHLRKKKYQFNIQKAEKFVQKWQYKHETNVVKSHTYEQQRQILKRDLPVVHGWSFQNSNE